MLGSFIFVFKYNAFNTVTLSLSVVVVLFGVAFQHFAGCLNSQHMLVE